jgi:outer membrane lipoprotein-sorting protein
MAEEFFKNVKVLKGIPVDQFMATMGFFSASLGENCTYCHVEESGGSWERYADDNAHKQTARRMIEMVAAINRSYFSGAPVLTCYSCHRGSESPKITPSLAELYGPPTPLDPDEVLEPAPGSPTADQILDRYLQALGSAQKVAALTSFQAKGTFIGYADTNKSAVEIWAKAPAQRITVVHTLNGDSTTTYDGRNAWSAAPQTERPVPVLALTGGDLEGAKLDAQLAFPAGIKQILSGWRVGSATIEDREVQVVQASSAARTPVKLYFDKSSGLLLRQVRYTSSPVGLNPTQIDYSDYREVAGVKMAFRWTASWLDGRSTTELTDVQPNATIDDAKFAKPVAPPPPSALTRQRPR